MGKRKRKKISSTLTWKALAGLCRLLFQGVLKTSPLLLIGAIGLGIFWGIRENLYADPGFLVETLEVSPSGVLSEGTRSELERECLRRNLFAISLGEVARLVEQDPKIQRAKVIREFPQTLRIEISERIPFAELQVYPKGPYYSVGEDGVVLAAGLGRNSSLLLIEGYKGGARPEIGRAVPLPGLRESMALAKAFWAHPLGRSEAIEKIRIETGGGASLFLANGPELRFGPEPMKRIHTLHTVIPLLRGPDRKRILYVDLQYQDLVVRKK